MFEDEGIEEGADGLLLVLVELGEGLELEPELLIGAAFVLLEDQRVGGDPEGPGEVADAVEGGPGGADLVAVDRDEEEVD